jgi:hypothetical protein
MNRRFTHGGRVDAQDTGTFDKPYEVRVGEQQFNAVVSDGIAEASSLGLRAGIWPDALLVGAVRWQRAQRLPSIHGAFSGYYYTLVGSNLRLSVFND